MQVSMRLAIDTSTSWLQKHVNLCHPKLQCDIEENEHLLS